MIDDGEEEEGEDGEESEECGEDGQQGGGGSEVYSSQVNKGTRILTEL